MKKYLLVIGVMAVCLPYFLHDKRLDSPTKTNTEIKEDSVRPALNMKTIDLPDSSFRYDYFIVDQTNPLQIIDNVEKKLSSTEIVNEKQCRYLANGGFYTKEDKKIGLLKVNGSILSKWQANQLFNGIVYASSSGYLAIHNSPQNDRYDDGFQSGPLLIYDGQNIRLSIKNDEHERRMVMATTPQNQAIFIAIIGSQASFEGPKLASVASVLQAIAQQENITIQNAVNLDGGTASVLFTDQNKLKELQPVGTFLCFH